MQAENQISSRADQKISLEEEKIGGNHEKVTSEERLMHFTWA